MKKDIEWVRQDEHITGRVKVIGLAEGKRRKWRGQMEV